MIIKKLSLSNFQVHKKLDIDLEQFTAIVGPSSSGKSSVLRALQFLFYGDWDKTYPTDLEKETAVAVQLDDGTVYARFRKGNTNKAIIKKPGQKTMSYQDFGDLIPGLLEEFNVRPIKVGTAKINLNFANQDDAIFMVSESKPTKAQWLGRLYGAHIINNMLRLMSKDKKTAEADRQVAAEEVKGLQVKLKSYKDLDLQLEDLQGVEPHIAKLQAMRECQLAMVKVMQGREWLRNREGLLSADTESIKRDLERLESLKDAMSDRDLCQLNTDKLRGSEGILGANTVALRADAEKLRTLREHKVAMEDMDSEIPGVKNGIISREDALKKLREQLKNSMFVDGKCPVCGCKPKKLDEATLAQHLKELIGA